MASQENKLDLIIFGATGFTGKVAVYEVIKLAKEKGFTWGISGRSISKLEVVLKEVSKDSGEDITKIPIVLADVNDEGSLKKMATKAKVVVNCVGPYRLFGENVVKSCIASGAHHVDISGEERYLEQMQLDYHKAAQDKGIYIIGACGVDCIPTDLGVVCVKNQFPDGDVNSVEIYIEVWSDNPSLSGPMLNFGTFESAVYHVGEYTQLWTLRKKLFPKKLPSLTPKLRSRFPLHRRDNLGWCMPFLGADESVIGRSQRHLFEIEKERPVQVKVYAAIKSLMSVVKFAFFGFFFVLLAQFQLGRNLLLKYPCFFTGGTLDHNGPSPAMRKSTNYRATLYGEGWTEKMAEPTDQHKDPPNKKVTVKVSCKDPGYQATSRILLLSAITILKESDKMPDRGGVYTTGGAFAKTSLIEELNKHEIKFEVNS